MPPSNDEPDFVEYHRSMTSELHALKNRIRNLVRHWQTDGEYKELALRSMLRRHLPESIVVGRGFIVTPHATSTQIDILVVDGTLPTLFRDGDLMIVTPDAVRAVIEVKTSLEPSKMPEVAVKLAKIEKLCRDASRSHRFWTGLFVYEGKGDRQRDEGILCRRQQKLLAATGEAFLATNNECPINCISYGRGSFIRYWTPRERRQRTLDVPEDCGYWESYRLRSLAPSYFMGNLIVAVSPVKRDTGSFAWFPLKEGKNPYRRFRMMAGSVEPEDVRIG